MQHEDTMNRTIYRAVFNLVKHLDKFLSRNEDLLRPAMNSDNMASLVVLENDLEA